MTSLLGVALAANVASGATIAWNNYAGGAWSNPGNWSSGGVPGPGDDAVIALDGTYTVTLDTNVTVNSLTVGSTNGTQTVTLAASNNLTGTFNFGSNAVFNVSSNAELALSGVINNQGAINWGTTNALWGLGTYTVSNTGTFNLLTNFSSAGFISSKNSFINSGTIQLAANLGNIAFAPNSIYVTNSGVVTVGTNSTLSLQGSDRITFLDGTVIAGPGLLQNSNSDVFFNGNITVNGTFELDYDAVLQGSHVLNGTGIFNWNGGTIGNNVAPRNSTTFGSNLVVNVTGAVVDLQTFTNLGVVNCYAGLGEGDEDVAIFNNCGLFVLQSSINMSALSAPSGVCAFNNYGTISVPPNVTRYMSFQSYPQQTGWAFTNYGTIEVGSNANFSMSGSSNYLTFADGTIINCNGNFEIGPGYSAAYLVANGTITVNGPLASPYGLLELYGVYISGTQTWTGTGSIGIGGTPAGGFIEPGTTTFATNFHAYLSGGGLYLDGHTLNNLGAISMIYDNEIDDLGHAGTFNNYGTIAVQSYLSVGADFSGYEGYTNFGSSFNNYGIIQYNDSGWDHLLNHWQFSNSGTISAPSSSTLFMEGLSTTLNDGTVFTGGGQIELDAAPDVTFTGNLLANGNIQVNTALTLGSQMLLQGTQVWSGTGSLAWSGGSINQPGTTTIASNLAFNIADDPDDASHARLLNQNHILNIQGTLLWTSTNPVQMSNQATFMNNGLVLLETNGQLQQLTSDCAFDNQPGGIVRAVSGASAFNCPFDNAGLLDFEGGSLALSNRLVLEPSARCQFALSGSAPLSVPSLNAAGTLVATLPNGASVTNGTAFPLVSYTANNGTFPNLQPPPLPPNLQWQLAYGPTALMLEATYAPPHLSALTKLPNGAFQFTFTGPPGNRYQILASTNLVDWAPLQTNGAFSGQTNFTDSAATNFPRRFYRAVIEN